MSKENQQEELVRRRTSKNWKQDQQTASNGLPGSALELQVSIGFLPFQRARDKKATWDDSQPVQSFYANFPFRSENGFKIEQIMKRIMKRIVTRFMNRIMKRIKTILMHPANGLRFSSWKSSEAFGKKAGKLFAGIHSNPLKFSDSKASKKVRNFPKVFPGRKELQSSRNWKNRKHSFEVFLGHL